MNTGNNKGFTLIELLVVVAIIGVLSSIAIPAFNDYKDKAREARALSEISGIRTAVIDFYANEENRDQWDVVPDNSGGFDSSQFDLISGFAYPNIEDPWGNPYQVDACDVTTPGRCQEARDIGPCGMKVYSNGKNGISESSHSTCGGDDFSLPLPLLQ